NFISGKNIQLTASANGIEVATANDVTFENLTVNKTTKLGDHFTVNNAGDVTYDGSITNDYNIVNKQYVDNMAAGAKTHYYSVNSTVTGAGSNYDNDGATGTNALAAGVKAKATGDSATAVGQSARA